MNKKYKLEVSPSGITPAILKKLTIALERNINDSHISIYQFQEALSKITNSVNVVATNSGTAALHLALLISGVKEGDEVICPTFTFVATASAILYLKAKPVFVDSEKETLNICPQLLEESIISGIRRGKKPKAAVVVHNYGMPAQLDTIISICEKYNVVLLEDAASALGSRFQDKQLGTFGKAGVISFNYNKIITTTAGGVFLTDDHEYAKKALYLSNHSKEPLPYYEHHQVGFNYRMSGMCAELGLQQIDELQSRLKIKREIFNRYEKALNNMKGCRLVYEPANCFSNRWITTVIFQEEAIQKELKKFLEEELIETRFLWNPMHRQPVFSSYTSFLNGNSDYFFKSGLCLPSGISLQEKDQEFIIEVIGNLLK
jgi:dTDP-4-amino-4,6-dideoxygalactose transaminase